MTKASRDTQARRKGKERKEKKRERKRERERERGREKREKERRSVPECYHSGTPQKAKREEGKGRGRKGVKVRTDSNKS